MKKRAYTSLFTTFAVMASLLLCGSQAQAKTYLGVATAPANPEVANHLKLDAHVGLTVLHVDQDSAAAGEIEEGDILFKLDDQILIEPRQLAVLIRNHEPGDEVELTLYRRGNKIEKKITLKEADEPAQRKQRAPTPGRRFYSPYRHPPAQRQQPPHPGMRADEDSSVDKLQRELEEKMNNFRDNFGNVDEMLDQLRQKMDSGFSDGTNVVQEAHHAIDITKVVNGRKFNYTRRDGDQHLEVADKDGDVIFDGPINTEEQREDLPEDAVEFLNSIDTETEYEPKEKTELIPSNAI